MIAQNRDVNLLVFLRFSQELVKKLKFPFGD